MIKSRSVPVGVIMDETGLRRAEDIIEDLTNEMKNMSSTHVTSLGGTAVRVAFMSDRKHDEVISLMETLAKVLNAARL